MSTTLATFKFSDGEYTLTEYARPVSSYEPDRRGYQLTGPEGYLTFTRGELMVVVNATAREVFGEGALEEKVRAAQKEERDRELLFADDKIVKVEKLGTDADGRPAWAAPKGWEIVGVTCHADAMFVALHRKGGR